MKEEILKKLRNSLTKNTEFLKIIDKARNDYEEEIESDNNKIFVYIKSIHYCRTLPNDEIIVPRGSEKEDVRRYANLETGEGEIIYKDYFNDFESENNVIVPDYPIYTPKDFFNLRAKFILDSMIDGQEETVQKVLKRK